LKDACHGDRPHRGQRELVPINAAMFSEGFSEVVEAGRIGRRTVGASVSPEV
jgi:hypothetical protein